MQKLIIAGTIIKENAVLRRAGSDDVLGFSIVVDNGKDREGNKRDGTFYDCSIWGKRAAKLEPHFKRGLKLTLIGRPTARAHNEKAYLGIRVDDFTFMGEARQQDGHGQSQGGYDGGNGGSGYGAGGQGSTQYGNDPGGEIPFAAIKLI